MFATAVEVGIAAFMANPNGDDSAVSASLLAAGVEPWLADRLVAWLPVTFGRVLLKQAKLSDEYLAGDETYRLDDDPVFRAAMTRAASAVREEVEVIGLRSAEVEAANNAANAGSRLEDLVFTPIALTSPLPPVGEGHGGVPDVCEIFAGFLEGHGHAIERGSTYRTGQLEFNACIYPRHQPGRVHLQADFTVRHPALAVAELFESFAGVGSTFADAIGDAVMKFERSSVHVLIAALLDRDSCADQVSWERLEHPSGPFDLCLGSQLIMHAQGLRLDISPLLDDLLAALRDVSLSRAVHGLRLYVCRHQGTFLATEVLVDNEVWPRGEELASAHPGLQLDHVPLWATRLFAMLVPLDASSRQRGKL